MSDPAVLTIEELALRTRMSVRNLREWRTLGLLPPAEMRGRVGYYAPEIAERVDRIRSLHAQGFKLGMIRQMLEASAVLGEDVTHLASIFRGAFREEEEAIGDGGAFTDLWPGAGPKEIRRAIELGVVRELADGRLVFADRRVARVSAGLRRLGLSLAEALEPTEEIRKHLDAVAGIFERVWKRHVWKPLVESGQSEAALADLPGTLAEVKTLALEGVIGLFRIAMEARVEESIAREVARAAGRARPKAVTRRATRR